MWDPPATHTLAGTSSARLRLPPTYADSLAPNRILKGFHQLFGLLKTNPEKTEFYGGGLSAEQVTSILDSIGFKKGVLPVRYLGVPLTPGKLSTQDCTEFAEKTTQRIKSWTAKHLSYAGRVQLINSVLFAMANYWLVFHVHASQEANVRARRVARDSASSGLSSLEIWNHAVFGSIALFESSALRKPNPPFALGWQIESQLFGA
ncbi:hypothetical protein CRG98_013826 [Punica granatum]|uniref:Uncharacterized protein n=1 Tax=Punica granatum TaxID=22663 RepID=A0A2I0KB52_PUNGR|nr:hypothetical protein CRG98_013826 [Punica granatum]